MVCRIRIITTIVLVIEIKDIPIYNSPPTLSILTALPLSYVLLIRRTSIPLSFILTMVSLAIHLLNLNLIIFYG